MTGSGATLPELFESRAFVLKDWCFILVLTAHTCFCVCLPVLLRVLSKVGAIWLVEERAIQSYEGPNPAGFSFLPASQGL